MWGKTWGQMLWGSAAAVPAVDFWGTLLLGAVLLLIAQRLRKHAATPARAGLLVLFLALLLPISRALAALPFTFSNGTLADATQVNSNFNALDARITNVEAHGTSGQSVTSAFSSQVLSVAPVASFTLIPGLSVTITVPAGAVVMVSADVGVQTTSTAAAGFSSVDVALTADGNFVPQGGYQRIVAANSTGTFIMTRYASFTTSLVLTPGAHTLQLRAGGEDSSGAAATVGGDSTSPLQGELTATVLKL